MVAFIYKGTKDLPTYRSERVSTQDIPEVTAFVEAELEKMDCPMKTQMQIDIAIDELYCNITSYAYEGREPGPAEVMVGVPEGENGVEITFIDEGRPYNPLMREDPDVTLSVEERGIGGLGIYMVKKSMDDMVYEYRNDKNILRIKKLF